MFLAAKQAICHMLLVLPHSAQFFLKGELVAKECNLLKLVNAHHDSYPFLFGYFFGQLQNFPFRIITLVPLKREREIIHWIRAK